MSVYFFTFGGAVEMDLEHTRKGICIGNYTLCAVQLDDRSGHGSYLYLVEINLILEIEAAHKSSAISGDLVRIERKPLLFCHFYRDLSKV